MLCYINHLVTELNKLNLGIDIGNKILSMLLYADDMVVAKSEANLQKQLDCISEWCKKNGSYMSTEIKPR